MMTAYLSPPSAEAVSVLGTIDDDDPLPARAVSVGKDFFVPFFFVPFVKSTSTLNRW
jgi:hypothetical protein